METPDHLYNVRPFSVTVLEYGTGKPENNRLIVLEVHATKPLDAMIAAEWQLSRNTTSKFIALAAIDLSRDFYFPE